MIPVRLIEHMSTLCPCRGVICPAKMHSPSRRYVTGGQACQLGRANTSNQGGFVCHR
ncbi:hypothetical protein BaRGS_00028066, partial [Batillaria attramentaria]